ncbi:MAG: tetratricopeptide repeat protein, partial [Candidatus Sericytochromatia bacterium]|nr:tetratricopeptide repeat protein [Candidatus Sericytochromatia bacterium]
MDERPPKPLKSNSSFLGQILVDKKKISEKQLETALNTQSSKIGQNKLIGDILVNQGALTSGDLQDALSQQSVSVTIPGEEMDRIDKLKATVQADPQNIENRWQLAQAYMKVLAFPQAVSELQAIVRTAPDNLRALQSLGRSANKTDNWELAATAWQKAFSISADDVSKHGVFEARIKLGEQHMLNRNPQAASREFQTLLRLEPENPTFLYHFAMTFRMQDQPASAIKYLQQAAKTVLSRPDPVGGKIFVALGEILIDSKKREDGLQALQQALRFAPKDPNIFLKLGEIYHAMGLTDKAVDAYSQALQHDRRLVGAHLALGQINDQKNNRDKAMGHFRTVVELDPQNALGY